MYWLLNHTGTPKKKVHEFPVSSRDVTNQTPTGQEKFNYDVIIPAQGEFGCDIPAGARKLVNLFLRCTPDLLFLKHLLH